MHNALKFSVVFGTISSYNSIIIRPASTSLIEISKKHLFRTVFSGFFDFPILQEVDFSSRVFGLVSFLSLFRSEFRTSKRTNERAEDLTDSLLVTKRFTDSNRRRLTEWRIWNQLFDFSSKLDQIWKFNHEIFILMVIALNWNDLENSIFPR